MSQQTARTIGLLAIVVIASTVMAGSVTAQSGTTQTHTYSLNNIKKTTGNDGYKYSIPDSLSEGIHGSQLRNAKSAFYQAAKKADQTGQSTTVTEGNETVTVTTGCDGICTEKVISSGGGGGGGSADKTTGKDWDGGHISAQVSQTSYIDRSFLRNHLNTTGDAYTYYTGSTPSSIKVKINLIAHASTPLIGIAVSEFHSSQDTYKNSFTFTNTGSADVSWQKGDVAWKTSDKSGRYKSMEQRDTFNYIVGSKATFTSIDYSESPDYFIKEA